MGEQRDYNLAHGRSFTGHPTRLG